MVSSTADYKNTDGDIDDIDTDIQVRCDTVIHKGGILLKKDRPARGRINWDPLVVEPTGGRPIGRVLRQHPYDGPQNNEVFLSYQSATGSYFMPEVGEPVPDVSLQSPWSSCYSDASSDADNIWRSSSWSPETRTTYGSSDIWLQTHWSKPWTPASRPFRPPPPPRRRLMTPNIIGRTMGVKRPSPAKKMFGILEMAQMMTDLSGDDYMGVASHMLNERRYRVQRQPCTVKTLDLSRLVSSRAWAGCYPEGPGPVLQLTLMKLGLSLMYTCDYDAADETPCGSPAAESSERPVLFGDEQWKKAFLFWPSDAFTFKATNPAAKVYSDAPADDECIKILEWTQLLTEYERLSTLIPRGKYSPVQTIYFSRLREVISRMQFPCDDNFDAFCFSDGSYSEADEEYDDDDSPFFSLDSQQLPDKLGQLTIEAEAEADTDVSPTAPVEHFVTDHPRDP